MFNMIEEESRLQELCQKVMSFRSNIQKKIRWGSGGYYELFVP